MLEKTQFSTQNWVNTSLEQNLNNLNLMKSEEMIKIVKGSFNTKWFKIQRRNNEVNTQLRLDAKRIFNEEMISFEKTPF